MIMKKITLCVLCLLARAVSGYAQDATPSGDGFGFDDDSGGFGFGDSGAASSGLSVSIGGEVSATLTGYGDRLFSADIGETRLGDIFAGKLNLAASGKVADAVINLKVAPTESPFSIDEAYLRAYFGKFDVEAGIRKLTWGKADSAGPLDVINPIDYSDLSNMSGFKDNKLARPLVHVSYGIGGLGALSNIKLEGVFVPWFAGHYFADDGRWAPAQLTDLPEAVGGVLVSFAPSESRQKLADALPSYLFYTMSSVYNNLYSYTPTLEYLQAGLRLTSTIGPADMGLQYYYGRLPRFAFSVNGDFTQLNSLTLSASEELTQADQRAISNALSTLELAIDYNNYAQIGVDYAQVLAGFNVRAELAANITGDLDGDNGAIYNPSLAWSLGFDRDLFWGVNLNLQGSGSLRLMDDKVSDNPAFDTEANTNASSTRLTAVLSKKFLRDELELKATTLWGIEAADFLFMPSLIWTRNDVSVELSGGIFGGDEKGELGQYHDNGFVKMALRYAF
jgi:hypothetical protein